MYTENPTIWYFSGDKKKTNWISHNDLVVVVVEQCGGHLVQKLFILSLINAAYKLLYFATIYTRIYTRVTILLQVQFFSSAWFYVCNARLSARIVVANKFFVSHAVQKRDEEEDKNLNVWAIKKI